MSEPPERGRAGRRLWKQRAAGARSDKAAQNRILLREFVKGSEKVLELDQIKYEMNAVGQNLKELGESL